MRKQTIRTWVLRTLGACTLSAALLLAAGCVENLGLSPASGAGDRTLGIEMEDGMTKVSVDDGTSGALSWTTGDAIAVRVSGTSPTTVNEYRTSTVNVTNKTVTVSLTGNQEINYYSVYPAASKVDGFYDVPTSDKALRVIYPTTYTVPSGLAAAQQNLWSPMPMVAWNTEGGVVPGGTPKTSLMFYHVGGVLRIKLTNVPTTATSCTVTFVGMDHVTGTYKVGNPGTTTANTDARVTGTNNVVTFNFAAGQATRWINVPLPTGDYSSLTAVTIAAKAGSTVLKSVTKEAKWYLMRHGQGRRLDANLNAGPGPLHHVNIGSTDDVTLWKDQTITRTAQACDNNGTVISGATITWASSNTTVATVDNTGKVTTNAAGTTTLTATASAGGVTKTASYKVHVNVLSGLTLDRSSMTLKAGTTGNLTATATYTTNGNFEVPQVTWSVTPAGRVTFAKTPTESGAANTIAGATKGTATITARIPANTYGTHAAFTATCSVTVFPPNVIPGKFTVSEGKSVYFAKGNVQFTATYNGGTAAPTDGVWSFAEHQWDVVPIPLPPYTVGNVYTIGAFQWATAGNGAADSYHTQFDPSPWTLITNATYGPKTNGFYTNENEGTWSAANIPHGMVIGNTWRGRSVEKYCEWGIHFDDNGNDAGDVSGKTSASWYTLSAYEWNYLLSERPRAGMLVAHAAIWIGPTANNRNIVRGLLLLPDDWTTPVGCTLRPWGGMWMDNSGSDVYLRNQYFLGYAVGDGRWEDMEAAGAVFLPLPWNSSAGTYGSDGMYYWTSSAYALYGDRAYHMVILGKEWSYADPKLAEANRANKFLVRLVHD